MKSISIRPLAVSLVAASLLSAAAVADFAPKLVWNGSESAPPGLYVIRQRPADIGDYALVEPPQAIKSFIEERGYLPPETPLIKRVAASAGDEICRVEDRILINKTLVARALAADSMGRPMPVWTGCRTLGRDEIFLLNDHQNSLDGRYFGPTRREHIIGVAAPVWTFSRKDRIGE